MGEDTLFSRTHIPGLDEFIPGFPRGGLVLVSGLPGSGKTIFGMSYIYYGAIEAGEPGIYVSVYESRNRFLQLSKTLGMDFENVMKGGLVEHIWVPVLKEFGVTSAVNMMLERVEATKAKRLVIDSFTAMKQTFKEPHEARIFLQSLLSKVLEELRCTTLLIKEGEPLAESIDFEEYTADAVIGLKRDYFEDKVIRILEIKKLRGANIPYPKTIYTIRKGIEVMSPTKIPAPQEPITKGPEAWPPPDPANAYTTGIPDLDHAIGGYPKGSTVLIEVDPKFTPREYCLLLYPPIASFILKGRHSMLIPSGGVSPDLLGELFERYGVSGQVLQERVHIFYEKGAPIEKKANVVDFDPKPVDEAGRRFIEFGLKLMKESGKPILIGIGVDRVIRLGGEEAIGQLALVQDCVRTHNKLMIWLLKPTKAWFGESLAPLADVHLKITRRHGCMLVYGVKPRTPLYVARLDPEKAPPVPKLTPIV